jgi:hypothetical protein
MERKMTTVTDYSTSSTLLRTTALQWYEAPHAKAFAEACSLDEDGFRWFALQFGRDKCQPSVYGEAMEEQGSPEALAAYIFDGASGDEDS